MSITVELADLPATVVERGPAAFLVTTGEQRPHVVSVLVAVDDGALVVGAGRRTSANVAAHPEVTLLWPHDADHPAHSLLVDGTARLTADGDHLVIDPSSAILHRAGGRSQPTPRTPRTPPNL